MSEPSRKTTRLRQLLSGPEPSFLMEAHNGLSARVAEEAGFAGIWASGLSISAALGVRDSNEASWTQVLEVLEFMSDATSIPILVDGDTGYGNFNTMRRVVRKLEMRRIAGICIEDKIFPKTNSFIKGTSQPLADIDEFCGKIKAGKDAQEDEDFVLIARVEAFIAGWGLEEALRRAEAYRQAGADAILIHSALRNPSEILRFKEEWGNRHPVVIVPTKYYTTPTDVFRDHGFAAVIWANHLMRASLAAMQETAHQIFKDQSLLNVEERVAPVSEVFRIQGEGELAEAERLYLPANRRNYSALVLAASRGAELGELTADRPKCMVEIAGKPLLAHIADTYRSIGIKDITAVRGYCKTGVNLTSLSYVDNDEYSQTQEVYSLYQARAALQGNCIVSYGDVLFRKYIPQQLIDMPGDISVAVDTNWRESRNAGRTADYVTCSEPHSRESFYRSITLREFHTSSEAAQIHGEWMGFLRLSAEGARIVSDLLEELAGSDQSRFRSMKVPELIRCLVERGHTIGVAYTAGHWLDVDSVADVAVGSSF